MPTREPTTRERIVELADRLFYRRGYEHTSFADIADAVKISRGNFYHHFKSKDEILDAVIAARFQGTTKMLEQWERAGQGPAERIRCFIDMLVANRLEIKRHGCPVGTLCTELAKLEHGAQRGANELLTLFRGWLRRQLEQLGRAADADRLALHLLARSQGIAVLANALHDDDFIRHEVRALHSWLDVLSEENADVHRAAAVRRQQGLGESLPGSAQRLDRARVRGRRVRAAR